MPTIPGDTIRVIGQPWRAYPAHIIWPEDVKVSLAAKGLFILLWTYADPDGENCFPGRRGLARQCNCSIRSITRLTEELNQAGLIQIEQPSGGTNQYLLMGRDNLALGGAKLSHNLISDDDEEEKKTSRDDLDDEIVSRWGALADQYGLPKVQAPIARTRVKRLRSLVKVYPEFWTILSMSLAQRSPWYQSKRQPSFDQATRRSYFDSKILEGTWNGTDDRTDLERQQAEYESKFQRLD